MTHESNLRRPIRNIARASLALLFLAACGEDKQGPSSDAFEVKCKEGPVTGAWIHSGYDSGFVSFTPTPDREGVAVISYVLKPGVIDDLTGVDFGCGGSPEKWGTNCSVQLTGNNVLQNGTLIGSAECPNSPTQLGADTVNAKAILIQ